MGEVLNECGVPHHRDESRKTRTVAHNGSRSILRRAISFKVPTFLLEAEAPINKEAETACSIVQVHYKGGPGVCAGQYQSSLRIPQPPSKPRRWGASDVR